MGAGAVQSVGNDNRPEVKAISAWSDLGDGYTGSAPIQGQGADYDAWITPPVRDDVGPDDPGKLDGFDAVRERGVDVQEIVIESGTHLAWSHVTWAYTSTWSEEIALFYALAWFDKYLAGDLAATVRARPRASPRTTSRARARGTVSRASTCPPTRSAARTVATSATARSTAEPQVLARSASSSSKRVCGSSSASPNRLRSWRRR